MKNFKKEYFSDVKSDIKKEGDLVFKTKKITDLVIDICWVTDNNFNKKELNLYSKVYNNALNKVLSVKEQVRRLIIFSLFEENAIYFNPEKWFFWPWWEQIKEKPEWKYLQRWHEIQKQELAKFMGIMKEKKIEEYKEFWNWILTWVIWWILIWKLADSLWLQKNSIAEGVTRFVAWNSDTLWWIWQRIVSRLKNKNKWSQDKIIDNFAIWWARGMTMWPIIHILTQELAKNPSWVSGVFYASAYSNADNMIWWLNVLRDYIKQFWVEKWIKKFLNDPFQVTNATVILWALFLNIIFRNIVNDPITSQTLAAIEWNLLNVDSLISVWVVRLYEKKYIKDFEKSISCEEMLNRLKIENFEFNECPEN